MKIAERSHESRSRAEARRNIADAVGPEQWAARAAIAERLQTQIATHPLQSHPIIGLMADGLIDKDLQQQAHLEFAGAFSQPFTDLLLSAMLDTTSLRAEHGPAGHMAARFLIGLNLLEELGYTLDPEDADDFSTPMNSHYMQLLGTVEALGISAADCDAMQPTPAVQKVRDMMHDARGNLMSELICLAVCESLFPIFSGLWAESVADSGGIDVTTGFHAIHVDDEDGDNIEDDHSGDAWHLLTQAVTEARADEAVAIVDGWLVMISEFLDSIAARADECAA
jgi:hypothetical protein